MNIEHHKYEFIERLPELELSYGTIIHKKVYAEIYAIIPKGIKVLVWFTYFKNNNICIVIDLNNKDQIKSITPYTVCFSNDLALGTILYGTLFKSHNISCFSCENIHFHKGNDVENLSYSKKLNILKDMFTNDLMQTLYTSNMLLLGIPILRPSYKEAFHEAHSLPYPAYGIQLHKLELSNPLGMIVLKEQEVKEAIFKV